MRRSIAIALLATSLTASSIVTRALAHSLYQPFAPAITELKVSDLRSAYLLRDGIVRYDANANSPAGLRAQLQRHFDVVIGLLMIATPRSVETAMSRLEAADDHSWSPAERKAWRQKILAMRNVQLQRLAAYRDRGLFPLNEGVSTHPVPIFVDEHDTACAVGHLMRLSEWQADVTNIESTNNQVYVPDAPRSSVAVWVLTSGLTLEEAAIVQPGYGTPHTPFLTSDYEPGELSLVKDGLRYENFRIETQNFQPLQLPADFFHAVIGVDSFLQPISTGPLPDVNHVGFNLSTGFVAASELSFVGFTPVGSHSIVIGGQLGVVPSPDYRLIGATSSVAHMQRIRVNFDVSTAVPGTYFTQFTEHSLAGLGGFDRAEPDDPNALWDFTTTVAQAATILGTTRLQENHSLDQWQVRTATAGLLTQPTKLSVQSTIWVNTGAAVDSIVLGFQVVPEPASATLVVAGLAFAFGTASRRRS